MWKMIALLSAAALPVLPAGPALRAQDKPATATQELLNKPSAGDWSVYGPGQTHKLHKDKTVQGGGAMLVDVTVKPAAIQDIGAAVPVSGAISKGDRLIVAFWARLLAGGKDGTIELPVVSQVASTPFTPIVSGRVTVGPEWTLVSIDGTAAADHPAGSTNVALQLGGGVQRIDLGAVFVMRLPR